MQRWNLREWDVEMGGRGEGGCFVRMVGADIIIQSAVSVIVQKVRNVYCDLVACALRGATATR